MCNAWNHPPNCNCGWGAHGWSGGHGWPVSSGWHSGTGSSGLVRATSYPRSLNWHHYGRQDVCFSTTCPEPGCGETVYFVRHNDGCVWLDSLGWPWPKHRHCNAGADYLYRFLDHITAHLHDYESKPILGRVVKRVHRSFDLLYLVATENGQLASLSAPASPARKLGGIIVIRFSEDGLLLEDNTHEPVHVKDCHVASKAFEAYLHEPAFDVYAGWQAPKPKRRRRPGD